MGDSFSAGEGVVKKSAEIVSTARADLRTQITGLRGQMEQVKAHWEGEGARSFDQVSEAWKIQTQDIVDVLDTFEANLTGSQRQRSATLVRHWRPLRRTLFPGFDLLQQAHDFPDALGRHHAPNHMGGTGAALVLQALIGAMRRESDGYAAPQPMHVTVTDYEFVSGTTYNNVL